MFLSYTSNGLYRMVLLYNLPVFLSLIGDPKDFAMNAFAVTFIIELDDVTSGRMYKRRAASSILANRVPLESPKKRKEERRALRRLEERNEEQQTLISQHA